MDSEPPVEEDDALDVDEESVEEELGDLLAEDGDPPLETSSKPAERPTDTAEPPVDAPSIESTRIPSESSDEIPIEMDDADDLGSDSSSEIPPEPVDSIPVATGSDGASDGASPLPSPDAAATSSIEASSVSKVIDSSPEALPEGPELDDGIKKASDFLQESIDETVTPEYWVPLPAYVEAALFIAGRPMTEGELVEFFSDKFRNVDRNRIRWALRKVFRGLDEQKSAIELINPTKDKWSYQLRHEFPDEYLEKLEKFIPKEYYLDKRESVILTEIAYRQPVRSSEIVKILGPDVYPFIHALEEKGLVFGEKEKQYFILRTTEKFADFFGFDPQLRNLKIQLVWRLKKMVKSESKKDRAALEQLKLDHEKYEQASEKKPEEG